MPRFSIDMNALTGKKSVHFPFSTSLISSGVGLYREWTKLSISDSRAEVSVAGLARFKEERPRAQRFQPILEKRRRGQNPRARSMCVNAAAMRWVMVKIGVNGAGVLFMLVLFYGFSLSCLSSHSNWVRAFAITVRYARNLVRCPEYWC